MGLFAVIDPAVVVSGFGVGFLGVTGVGGGSLMTSMLVLAFGINVSVAVGADLLYRHRRKQRVAWCIGKGGRSIGTLCGGSALAASSQRSQLPACFILSGPKAIAFPRSLEMRWHARPE